MRGVYLVIGCLIGFMVSAQNSQEQSLKAAFATCGNAAWQSVKAFELSEYYLEVDDMDQAQEWLDKSRTAHFSEAQDELSAHIHSMQSELFYYFGLYQFGTYEAEKDIDISLKLQDSALIADAWFFKGINQIELENYQEALFSLNTAKNYSPSRRNKRYIRSVIDREHVFNNLALLKLKMNNLDGAMADNTQAYELALQKQSKRGIPNCEQLFGLIYIAKEQGDSARVYFEKSTVSANKSSYFDIALINQAYLMQTVQKDPKKRDAFFAKGMEIMEQHTVNNTFKRYFYKEALKPYENPKDLEKTSAIQHQLMVLEDGIRSKGNRYIQNITKQYVDNENKLWSSKLAELEKQKSLGFQQKIILTLGVLILILMIIMLTRKNRIQKTLMNQKNEISKDLHDDIGSGLSSILIHADLLLKDSQANEQQQKMLAKIAMTGNEISQRLNVFVWSLNTENNNLRNFCEYVKQYGSNLFDGTTVNFNCFQDIADAEQRAIPGDVRKNLFFCIKELLNNSLKHANASEVNVTMYVEGKHQLVVQVVDNGQKPVIPNEFGNGIKNIRNRIQAMKGQVDFQNTQGWQVTMRIAI